jgi:signal transduction histidine kinase
MSARSAPLLDTLAPCGDSACAPRSRPSPAALRRQAEDEARSAFLRTVSHELRTPLNAIIGFSEIISREMLGPLQEPRYREYAETVRDSGLKMLALVNDIIEIARLESGAADLDRQSESLHVAFADAARAAHSLAEARDVRFSCDVEPVDLHAAADSRALATVLHRLLENAVAFSPEGGEVRLRARRSGGSVRLEIEDDGPGIPQKDALRLLRPFNRGAPAPGAEPGAGLGLAVASLLVKAMQGHLRLNSCLGHGLTAAIRLPAG